MTTAGYGVLWQQLSLPYSSPMGTEKLRKLLQQTAVHKPSLHQDWKDLRIIKVHSLKTPSCSVLPLCNTPYSAIIVPPVGQSVSTQSERIPPKCFFPCAWGWQEGQAETVLDFVVKFVVALNSSWAACFQKELLPLCAPVRRLFPPKLECCGWQWEAEEGYCQPPPKRRRVPSKTQTSIGNW